MAPTTVSGILQELDDIVGDQLQARFEIGASREQRHVRIVAVASARGGRST